MYILRRSSYYHQYLVADYMLVGIQAGNLDDSGTVVEMESLYL